MATEEHKELVMKLLEERQQLERQLQMLKLQEKHGTAKDQLPAAAAASSDASTSTDRVRLAQKTMLKLALRKR